MPYLQVALRWRRHLSPWYHTQHFTHLDQTQWALIIIKDTQPWCFTHTKFKDTFIFKSKSKHIVDYPYNHILTSYLSTLLNGWKRRDGLITWELVMIHDLRTSAEFAIDMWGREGEVGRRQGWWERENLAHLDSLSIADHCQQGCAQPSRFFSLPM